MARYARNAVIFCVIGVVCGLALEVAIRIYARAPIFTLHDWRGEMVTILQGPARYHPVLGWVQASNYKGGGFNTLDYGVRKNSASDEKLDEGAILAVGDSFTAGSDVVDRDTWPAQLERLIGRRVINAGVGGYGVDQTVLNAERLLPIITPRLVLVGIYEDDINRSAYRVYNAPKPYFMNEGGTWTLHNSPVPRRQPPPPEPLYKKLLSYSLVAHIFFNKVAHDWWYTSKDAQYVRSGADPVAASCYALARLHKRLAANNISAIVVMQYNGRYYAIHRPPDPEVAETIRCAEKLGYAIVDEHPRVAEIAGRSVDELKKLYVMYPNGAFGHMSAAGNHLIAGMITDKIINFGSRPTARH